MRIPLCISNKVTRGHVTFTHERIEGVDIIQNFASTVARSVTPTGYDPLRSTSPRPSSK